MAIEGRLSEMDLPMLIQYACTEGQQARLQLRQDNALAELYFENGNLIHGVWDDYTGEEVVYRVLRWTEGEFSLEASIVSPAHTIETPWSALLVNGLQRLDEDTWDQTENHEEDYEMPENIQDVLEELGQQVPGFVSAAVVGMDGLGIAEHAAVAGVDVEAVNAQMTLLIKLVDTTVTRLTGDQVEDYLLTTQDNYLLVRFLEGKDHYLGIAADRQSGKLGNLRLNSRIFAQRLDQALPR
jgi:predicted regulator of Ras-like GTPase activity (Roadblock/LC7/MglB family)